MKSREPVGEIVKEDVLRILGENDGTVPLESIKSKIKASNTTIFESTEELKNEGLIRIKESYLELTESGSDRAETIVKRHLLLEDYFKKEKGGRPHKEADLIEHYVSREVLDTIKELSTQKEDAISLMRVETKQRGLITDLLFPVRGTFERIVSMGIFPGEKIRVINKFSDNYIVSVNNKKFALDRQIVKNIKVLVDG